MKKFIYTATLLFAITLVGCQKFTDIRPKGYNLLETVEDLDRILNCSYTGTGYGSFPIARTGNISSTTYNVNLIALWNGPTQTINYWRVFWDETVDRVSLAAGCEILQNIYYVVGQVANPVIARADNVVGDKKLAMQVKAEALVLRAWFHYLAVNLYAKAYNPATAATDGGVVYQFDRMLINQPGKQSTVAEVYEFILADLDAAFKLNSLRNDHGSNRQRVGKSFAHAVHAQVLMSLRKYPEAREAALASLAINSFINDHNNHLIAHATAPSGLVFSRPVHTFREDIFSIPSYGYMMNFTPEVLEACFEPNSVMLNYMPTNRNLGLSAPVTTNTLDVTGTSPSNEYTSVGLTTVDMHLIVAEALWRAGDYTAAKDRIEHVREHRQITDLYEPHPASTKEEIYELIRLLTRGEQWARYLDFINLKRWNSYPDLARNLYRTFHNFPTMGESKTFTLRPDSPLWINPFPLSVTGPNPNIKQNF
jgi:hypothetical protein